MTKSEGCRSARDEERRLVNAVPGGGEVVGGEDGEEAADAGIDP